MSAPEDILAGVVPNMPAEQYHAIARLSASGAKKLLRSPAHYLLERTSPTEPTAAMNFGTAVHAGVLEPDTFSKRVVGAPECDRRTKDGKALWAAFQAEHEGKLILSADDFERAQNCIAEVRCHPAADTLLSGAEVEVSMFWQDGKYKVPCKLRADIISHGGITDLKTCQDASPEAFGRHCASYQYHVQAAFYTSGAEHVLHATPEFFAFIAVESEPPHAVAVYAVPSNALLAGMHLVNIAMERYAECLRDGRWPGYPQTIELLQFPRWATQFNL